MKEELEKLLNDHIQSAQDNICSIVNGREINENMLLGACHRLNAAIRIKNDIAQLHEAFLIRKHTMVASSG